MPVRNTAHFLHECIDSILSQSYKSWELIAIDDHSTDNSYSILSEYAMRYESIKAYKNDGTGIISALRLAFRFSTGTYITRMDSDDIMVEEKLALMRESLTKRKQLSVGLVQYISETSLGEGYKKYADWLNDLTLKENNFSEIYKECVIPSPCWMLHREDLIDCGAFDPDVYPEDYDLCFRMRNNNIKVSAVNKIIHLWRDHDDRASRNDPHYKNNNFLNLKLHHFLSKDRDIKRKLILWGAGKKGKIIAKKLSEQNQNFIWISDNEKKVGVTIYTEKIMATDILSDNLDCQVIVAIAQRGAQEKIKHRLSKLQAIQAYFFC